MSLTILRVTAVTSNFSLNDNKKKKTFCDRTQSWVIMYIEKVIETPFGRDAKTTHVTHGRAMMSSC